MVEVTENGLEYEREDDWVKGSYEEAGTVIYFYAKIYDEPSDYGINDGRISKLIMTDIPDSWNPDSAIANFDRGWDVYPVDDDMIAALEWLVDELETIDPLY